MPDTANYLAWFCPGTKSFLDLRLPLFTEAAADFVTVRDSLTSSPKGRAAWRNIFHKWNIRALVFHTRNPRFDTALLIEQRLMLNPDGWSDEWTLCYVDGRTLIAGWKDKERDKTNNPFTAIRWDPDRLAFGPQALRAPTQASSDAIASGSVRATSSLSADEAFLDLMHYHIMGPRWMDQSRQMWEAAFATSLIGSTAAPNGPLCNGSLLLTRLDFTYRVLHGQPIQPRGTPLQPMDRLAEQLMAHHLGVQDSGPPASLFLAIRACRQALVENPHSAEVHLLLGEAYLRLAWKTRERLYAATLPHIALLRQAQAAAALQKAAQLDPNLEHAHELLVELYENAVQAPLPQPGKPWSEQVVHQPMLETALKHRREQVRSARARGPRLGESPDDFTRRIERLEGVIQRYTKDLSQRLDSWELAAEKKPLLARVQLALEQGLNEKAFQLLTAEDGTDSLRGPSRALAVQWTVALLLGMGRLQEAGEVLNRETPQSLDMLPPPLNLPAYEWFQIQMAAADGNYEEADQHLAAWLATARAKAASPAVLLAQTIGHQLLWDAPLATQMPGQMVRTMPALLGLPPNRTATLVRGLEQCLLLLQQESDLLALRGWLALEVGDTRAAGEYLSRVLALCREGNSEPRGGFTLNLRAGPLALLYSQWLDVKE
jgi:tetratricopeptide (TPR) repeat protein